MHPLLKLSAVVSYAFVVAIFALLAWALAGKVNGDSVKRNEAVIAQVRQGCERNMLRNGYSRARAHTAAEKAMARAYFTILDCQATYRTGESGARAVALPPALQHCWVRLTRQLYWKFHPLTTARRDVARLCSH